jgi:beta-xylosidase
MTYPTVGSLATTNQTHIQILAWNHDIPTNPLTTQTVCFNLSPLMEGYNQPATIRRIDQNNTNPVSVWQQMGQPVYPTPLQISQLQEASKMVMVPFPYTMKGNMLMATVDIPPQGIVSIVFPL